MNRCIMALNACQLLSSSIAREGSCFISTSLIIDPHFLLWGYKHMRLKTSLYGIRQYFCYNDWSDVLNGLGRAQLRLLGEVAVRFVLGW